MAFVCRQGAYTGYKPTRFHHRTYPSVGCRVETANGWYRGIVTSNGRDIERTKARRNRTEALALACARMIELKETSVG